MHLLGELSGEKVSQGSQGLRRERNVLFALAILAPAGRQGS